MKINVSKLLRIAVPLGFVIAASASPGHAETIYPFCKVGGGDLSNGVCNYSSFEQCRVSSAGYGMCNANPAYVAPTATLPAQRRAKRGS
jgi:Protein of unknown function (DUF3551)